MTEYILRDPVLDHTVQAPSIDVAEHFEEHGYEIMGRANPPADDTPTLDMTPHENEITIFEPAKLNRDSLTHWITVESVVNLEDMR